jgi:transcriptional regulator with XRE-family HTH domain
MAEANLPQDLRKIREQIARKVRDLRTERRLTQQELAKRLGVSQGHLSQLERGDGSFTAEQLVAILALFNVPVTHFAPQPAKHEQDLQNALARHGATHLRESTEVVPSEKLEELAALVREALISPSSRHLTALAPVLVKNAEHLGVLVGRLLGSGLERRLGWVIENTLVALAQVLPDLPRGPILRLFRSAEIPLDASLHRLSEYAPKEASAPLVDILDPVVTKRSAEQVEAAASPISRRWGILTSLQPGEFADALRAAQE